MRLDVSMGPGQASVPDLAGTTQEEATAALTKAGLTLAGTRSVDLPDQDQGKVVATDPPAGTVVSRDQGVTLEIASGKVVVPNLTGKHFSVAQATLTQLGLATKIVEVVSPALEGTVLKQTPSPNDVVPTGTEVTLSIARRATPTPSTTTVTVTTPPTTPTTQPTKPPRRSPTTPPGLAADSSG